MSDSASPAPDRASASPVSSWPPATPWHAQPIDVALAQLRTSQEGLSESEAADRLRAVGPNRLPSAPPTPAWVFFLRQFKSPLIYVLGLAAAGALLMGDVTDAGFILAVLGLNALIGGIQELKAQRSSQALQKLLRATASVVRADEVVEIDAERIVPGDVVWIESGNRVPADLRLLQAHSLQVDESLLTGESLAVTKSAQWVGAEHTPLADRRNMAYAGSIVTSGRGKGVVVATGSATHVGQLAVEVMTSAVGQPPLLLRIDRFARVVGLAALVTSLLVLLVGVAVHGRSIGDMFLFAVALAVSVIPEGMPVAITVALAVATTRMARRGAIVRQLGAVEGLGSCTLIASDKTGTLTCNELTVRRLWLPDGRTYDVVGQGYEPVGRINRDAAGQPIDAHDRQALEPLVRAAVLCNEADLHRHDGQWVWRGDPTDVALLSLGGKFGHERESLLDRYPQVNQIPFEPERRFSATYHRADGGTLIFVKGAPERVLAMCRLDEEKQEKTAAYEAASAMAHQGCRVLALASGQTSDALDETQVPPAPQGLRLLGFVGMIDPLRPGAKEAVAACHRAGMIACMITGDHPQTALAIGRDLGLVNADDAVVTGAELEKADDQQLDRLVARTRIFARVAPEQKLRIVQAAQRLGHFVAVTGDGVNDAPALRRANIGVAMGRSGTDVAREAADLVLSDDNFATIVAGVEEGRIAYKNIRNVIYMLVSTGLAEVVMVLLAVAGGLPLPLLPVQLLWLNLVTNGIQDVALAFEPGEGNELLRPPRPPREPIFNRLMIERTLIAGLLIGVIGFAVFVWLLDRGWSESAARNVLLLLMVLFENIHIGNCRSETASAFRLSPLRAPILLMGTIAAQLLHIVAMHVPWGQRILSVQPVSFSTWLTLLGLALTVIVAIELHKWTWARRYPVDAPSADKVKG